MRQSPAAAARRLAATRLLPRLACLVVFLLACLGTPVRAELSPRLQRELDRSGEPRKVWVYFTDKGLAGAALERALDRAEDELSDRVRSRRSTRGRGDLAGGRLVDVGDLPLHETYLAAVAATGAREAHRSRWLNAASFEATAAQIEIIAGLPGVARVDLVGRYVRRPIPMGEGDKGAAFAPPAAPSRYQLDYGGSLAGLEQINVPAVHDLGISGAGVLIGVLDNGFRTTHHALQGIEVVDAYDFVGDDGNVDWEEGDPEGSSRHGTQVLSCLAGYAPGELVGAAYGASVVLARTEDQGDEQPIEEDWWVAGLEWAELHGVDIVTSSLGYFYWYEYSDMDGDTAVTTIAGDLAAGRGVVVVTSAGNERGSDWGWVTAPADGDSIIAVGAVDSYGYYEYFSSPGPTYDGRIKPDLMALGRAVNVASFENDSTYTGASGTSFACPQTAGVAALILERAPQLTPMQVRDALRETADRADGPDNDYGWGVVDAFAAIQYFGPRLDHEPLPDTEDPAGPYAIAATITDRLPLDPGSFEIVYRLDGGAWQTTPLAAAGGDLYTGAIPGQPLGTTVEYYLHAADEQGIVTTDPFDAPDNLHAFLVGIDLIPPALEHTPLQDIPLVAWPPAVVVLADDNIGVASVSVAWSVDGAPQADFSLNLDPDGVWRASFPDPDLPLDAGDTLSYAITVTDQAAVPNTTTSPGYGFAILPGAGLVLVIDGDTAGDSPAAIAGWLSDAGYVTHAATAEQVTPLQLEAYQVAVFACGSSEFFGLPEGLIAGLLQHVRTGGRLLIEGGELGLVALFANRYPELAAEVLHVDQIRGANGGVLTPMPGQENHPVLTQPHALPVPMGMYYQVSEQADVLGATPDADILMRYNLFPTDGGLIVHDDDDAPQGGQIVYHTMDITRMVGADTGRHIVENALAWLTAEQPAPTCSIAGQITVVGPGDPATATVTAGPYSTTVAADGSYLLADVYLGDYAVIAAMPGHGRARIDLDLADGQQATGIDFTLVPVQEEIAGVTPGVEIPSYSQVGIESTLELAGHSGATVRDLSVDLDITHGRRQELTIELTSPAGTTVRLQDRSGGDANDIIGNYPLDFLVEGPGSLDDFLGEPVDGVWTLWVRDDGLLTTGYLNAWGLRVAVPQDLTAVDDGVPTPRHTALLGNAPNPFNPRTVIAFDLAHPGPVRLTVYDLRGRVVRRLVDEPREAGAYRVTWLGDDDRGRAVASGVYLYRFAADGVEQAQKMLLVR
jgi:serine protease AprX